MTESRDVVSLQILPCSRNVLQMQLFPLNFVGSAYKVDVKGSKQAKQGGAIRPWKAPVAMQLPLVVQCGR